MEANRKPVPSYSQEILMKRVRLKAYIGIDPGKTGALAVVAPSLLYANAWRYQGDIEQTCALLMHVCGTYDVQLATIEQVSAMPGQGVTGMFRFGGNYYGWQWALSILNIPYGQVIARSWQKEMLSEVTGDTKERSLSKARKLFPEVDLKYKKDNGKSDALHLACWGFKTAEPKQYKQFMAKRRLLGC